MKLKTWFVFIILAFPFALTPIDSEKSNTLNGTTTAGSTYTLTVTVDSLTVSPSSTYTVLVKLISGIFGEDIRDFHDIVLGARIESGTFLKEYSKDVPSIEVEGDYSYARFSFNLTELKETQFNIYARAWFREDKAWDIDPITDTNWFNAFTGKIETKTVGFQLLFESISATVIIVSIQRYRHRRILYRD